MIVIFENRNTACETLTRPSKRGKLHA